MNLLQNYLTKKSDEKILEKLGESEKQILFKQREEKLDSWRKNNNKKERKNLD